MRVSVNGRFVLQRVTGVQRYAHELIARIGHPLAVISPRASVGGVRGHLWEQSILPQRLDGALLWSPCNTGPLAVRKQVVTIHDCAFYDQPEGFSRKFATWYRWLVPKLARRIRRIITVSKFSKDRLAEYCRVDPEKIVVIPHGVDSRFRPLPVEQIVLAHRELGLPPSYVVYVGNLAARKNLRRLLEAWAMVSPNHPETSLVLVGAGDRIFRHAGLAPLPSSVVLAGYVNDAHLPAVYGGAEFFVLPSLYEGFGLPVLEAMSCGVAVMASNTTSLPEVAGGDALLVNPYCVESMADGLRRLLSDSELRRDLRNEACSALSHSVGPVRPRKPGAC